MILGTDNIPLTMKGHVVMVLSYFQGLNVYLHITYLFSIVPVIPILGWYFQLFLFFHFFFVPLSPHVWLFSHQSFIDQLHLHSFPVLFSPWAILWVCLCPYAKSWLKLNWLCRTGFLLVLAVVRFAVSFPISLWDRRKTSFKQHSSIHLKSKASKPRVP